MFVRIIFGNEHRDVTPEVASVLRFKRVVYMCGGCCFLHLSTTKTMAQLDEEIAKLVN